MKRAIVFLPILLLALLALAGCGQSAEKLNNEGNEAFANQDFEGALTAYHQAQEEAPDLAEPHYNAANTHYRQEGYEQAQQEIEQALVAEQGQEPLDQNSYYNLGNVFFQAEQYEAAIEAYKEALRLDPDDLLAKQNLELALRQLQQQQQEQQQQDQENQDQQDQDQENQDPQDQDQGNEDPQNQDQENQDQQNQDQNQDQQNQNPQDQQQDSQAGRQPQEILGLTEEQARQLLEAAAKGTESLEEFLQQMLVFPGAPPMEDW